MRIGVSGRDRNRSLLRATGASGSFSRVGDSARLAAAPSGFLSKCDEDGSGSLLSVRLRQMSGT